MTVLRQVPGADSARGRDMEAIGEKSGQVVLRVRVQPRASRNSASMDPEGRIRVALTAPPVEGAANKALVDFIAQTLGVPRRQVRIESGEKSRDKTLMISGVPAEQVRTRFSANKTA